MSQFELSSDQIAAFDDDGFFIAEGFLNREETDLLRNIARADQSLVAGAASRADGEGGAVKVRVDNELGESDIYSAIVRSEADHRTDGNVALRRGLSFPPQDDPQRAAASAVPGPGTRTTDTGTTTAACFRIWPAA